MNGVIIVLGSGADNRCKLILNRLYRPGLKNDACSVSDSLACGRLWLGRLPYERGPVSIDGLTILLDGELYGENGPEENPELLFASLYRENKLEVAVPQLDGSFAIAILDPQKNQLVLFNDRLGTRTFFITESKDGFVASSRPLFLLQDPSLRRRLSRQALFEMLVFRRICSSHALYTDIEIMPGGSLWRYENQKFHRKKIWKLNWKSPGFSRAEAPERFAINLVRAGKRRFGDTEKSAVLLSGGIDSRLVLAAAKAANKPVSCFTVGPFNNREVGVARAVAKAAGVPFQYIANPSEELIDTFDDATIAAEGVYSTPFTFFRRLPALAANHDVLFSGHALDIAFRGFYLPCYTLRIGKGSIRLPLLGKINSKDLPGEMIRIWRASTPLISLQKSVNPKFHHELIERQRLAAEYALLQADIQDPYNALEAFTFHTQSLHYTWNDFFAMETAVRHRALCFDKDLFDFCLSLLPIWRAQGEIPREALRQLAPSLADELDANTGYPLRWTGPQHIAAMVGRSLMQKSGLWPRPVLPTQMATHGSWSNLDQLLRLDPEFQVRLRQLSQDPTLLDTGILTTEGIQTVVDEHLSGAAYHGKLLHTLLTLSTWFRAYPYSEVV